MSQIPFTSITLLKDLASGSANARWTEFYRRYEPMMRDFMRARFPSVDEDDVLQETLLALTKALPDYQYTPDDRGHFRNYLTGILRNKAVDAVRRKVAHEKAHEGLADEARIGTPSMQDRNDAEEENAWRESAAEAAIEQLMANPAINPTTREVFRHVMLMHEPVPHVAAAFGMTRDNVDQIKSRMIARLSKLVRAMTAPE